MINKILDFLFPNYCGICGRKINERYTCENCLNILECYTERALMHTESKAYYDKLLCLFEYNGIMKKKMLQYKFNDKKYISKTFGEIIFYKLKKYNFKADYIVPVPISKRRMFERGYNQSECISRFFSKLSGVKLIDKCLIKVKNNSMQSSLSAAQRKNNVKNVYDITNEEVIKGKTIILFDDIFTTGATMNECAKVLKRAGAKEVIALALMYSVR